MSESLSQPAEQELVRGISTTVAAGAALIAALVLVSYWPSLPGTFIGDDVTHVPLNPLLKSERGLEMIWMNPRSSQQYYPLVFTTFWLEYRLWGLEPLGYHLVNIVLHLINSLLLWAILARLRVPGAWFAAAVFAIHPVHTESVALVCELKNILSGLFYLLSFWCYASFAGLGEIEAPIQRRWQSYYLSLFFFLLALFSKTVTGTLPAAIALIIWWKRGRLKLIDLLTLLPMLGMGLVMAAATFWIEETHFGATRLPLGLTSLDRIILVGQTSWFYLGKLFWPHPLAALYDRWSVDHRIAIAWVFPAAIVMTLLLAWMARKKLGRGPLVALLFFGGTLLPALGTVDLYPMRFSWVADHYQYLASIGPVVLATATLAALFTWARVPRAAVVACCGLTVLSLSYLTWKQSHVYRDVLTYWKHTIDKSPTAWMAYNNLAGYLNDQGGPAAAAPYAERAMELQSQSPESHMTLAMIRLDQGRPADALELLNKASLYYGGDLPDLCYQRARALMDLGRQGDAVREFDKLIDSSPGHSPAYFLRGRLFLKMGRLEDARGDFQHVLILDPDFVDAYCLLADTFAKEKRINEASQCYQTAIQRAPQYFQAYYNYSHLLLSIGQYDDALRLAQKAATLRPGAADAQNLIGAICFELGRKQEAVSHLMEAVKLDPAHIEARFNLAEALSDSGNKSAAIEQYQAILRINPSDTGARQALMKLQGG